MIHRTSIFTAICITILLILCVCFIDLTWQYVFRKSEPFRSFVSHWYSYLQAKREINKLSEYDSLLQAEERIRANGNSCFYSYENQFGVSPAIGSDVFVVKERSGWKIENTFQFCCGHRGITEGNGTYVFVARLVQQQWCGYIIFFDALDHNCFSNEAHYEVLRCEIENIGERQFVVFSTTRKEDFEVYIDEDVFMLSNQKWSTIYSKNDTKMP